MPTLFTTLPEMWPLQPGEEPCPAAEAAFALVEIDAAASDDAEGPPRPAGRCAGCAP